MIIILFNRQVIKKRRQVYDVNPENFEDFQAGDTGKIPVFKPKPFLGLPFNFRSKTVPSISGFATSNH